MSMIDAIPLLAGAGADGYQISRSVRLRSSASAYLSRTFGTPTAATTWTLSLWMKRGTLGASQDILWTSGSEFYFAADDTLRLFSTAADRITTAAKYRDPSAWYHILLSNNATAFTLYVNNVSVGTYTGATNFNTASLHNLFRNGGGSAYNDCYAADVYFIDGQALTPSSFGQTNTVTGVWQPIKYTGTYGTNGFYLNFSDNSGVTATTIGKDYSGNGNNWTPNNISITAGATYDSMLDVPTPYDDGGNGRGNYAVLNPLDGNNATLSGANLNFVTLATGNANTLGSIYVSTGKWYWELVGTSNGNIAYYGIRNGPSGYYVGYFAQNGNKDVNGSASSYGATFGNNDIIGVALDMDGGTITFYKNNVSQGAITIGNSGPFAPWIADGASGSSTTGSINFGQRPFTYTPPTGFKALNTQNLPDATIKKGNLFFNTATWSSDVVNPTAGQKSIALGFQPDLVWSKNRDNAESHYWMDSVRGDNAGNKWLRSNATAAEGADALGSTTASYVFNSTGFDIVDTNSASGEVYFNNGSASTPRTYVGWAWNAGGTSTNITVGQYGTSPNVPSIASTVRANTTAGFSVVTYSTPSSFTNATIGHGLGVVPALFIVKDRNTASTNWVVWHKSLTSTEYLLLNTTAGKTNDSTVFNGQTSTIFQMGSSATWGASRNYVAYCFAEVAGYSKFGSYTGNGSTDGPFVYCGFRPRWVLIKSTTAARDWLLYDTARGTYNVLPEGPLQPNTSSTPYGAGYLGLDILSNGFKLREATTNMNASGETHIFMAFAENPFKHSLAR